jgi:hypothetical protein
MNAHTIVFKAKQYMINMHKNTILFINFFTQQSMFYDYFLENDYFCALILLQT